jgi:hypothetical protein
MDPPAQRQDPASISLSSRAEAAWRSRRLAAADVLVREALESDPGEPAALTIRAEMALGLDRPDVALRAAALALQRAPALARAREAARRAGELFGSWPGIPRPSDARLVVIKSWGFGFWSDVYHVLTSCLLAEYTGRMPVVHWGQGCLFHEPGDENSWPGFFRPVSGVPVAAAMDDRLDVFHPRWQGRVDGALFDRGAEEGGRMHGLLLMGRREAVVISDFATPVVAMLPWAPEGHWSRGLTPDEVLARLMASYACPAEEAIRLSEAILAAVPDPSRCVAMHLRGTDKRFEQPEMIEMRAACLTHVERLLSDGGAESVLLMTDDSGISARLLERYGERLILPASTRAAGDIGLHYQRIAGPVRLGLEVEAEVLAAARCGWFIGSGSSNVATAVVHRWQGSTDRATLVDHSLHSYDYSGAVLHAPL